MSPFIVWPQLKVSRCQQEEGEKEICSYLHERRLNASPQNIKHMEEMT